MMAFVRDESGSATVFAAIAVLALVSVAVLVLHFGTVVAARHRAQAAADLAALAAAGALDGGVESACAAATSIANRNEAIVRECVVDGWDTTVVVTADVDLGVVGDRTVRATARAGRADG